ncbi:MAG: hypothetical protein ACK4N5_05340 [Myxococcales bacterium]
MLALRREVRDLQRDVKHLRAVVTMRGRSGESDQRDGGSMTPEERAVHALHGCNRNGMAGLCMDCAVKMLREAEHDALERAVKAVCGYLGRCNSGRCPCHAIRALLPREGEVAK